MRLYLGVMIRVRGCRWSTPIRCVGGEVRHWFALLLMDHSALLQVVRHPVRDRVDAHPVQCVWLSDLWAGPSALHSTLGVRRRSVEASVQGHLSERRRPKHQKRSGPVHRQAVSLYNQRPSTRGCQALPAAAADPRQVAQAATTLRCGQDQSASASQAPQGSHLLSRDSHRSRVGPSQPAWRVISAITGFGPRLPWGLLRPARKEASCLSVLLHPVVTVEPCCFAGPVASVTAPSRHCRRQGSERGISFSSW